MKMRMKILLIISAVSLLVALLMHFFISNFFLKNYQSLEYEYISINMDRVNEAITQREISLNKLLLGYAIWDDSYQYITDKNQKYVDTNMKPEVLKSSELDGIAFYNNARQEIFSLIASDDKRSSYVPFSEQIKNQFSDKNKLGALLDVNYKSLRYGLYQFNSNIYFISIQPVYKSDGKGKNNGYVMMMRKFNDDAVTEIREATGIDFNVDKILDITSHAKNLPSKKFTNKILNESTIIGKIDIDNIIGNHIATLEGKFDRSITLAGKYTIQYYYVMYIIAFLTMLTILYVSLTKIIISRIANINQFLSNLISNKNYDAKIPVTVKDEVGELKVKINFLLSSISSLNESKIKLKSDLDVEYDNVKQVAHELELNKNLISTIIKKMPSIILIINNDSIVTLANQNKLSMQILGTDDSEQIVGKKITELSGWIKSISTDIDKFISAKEKNKVYNYGPALSVYNTLSYYYKVSVSPVMIGDSPFFILRADDVTRTITYHEALIKREKLTSIGLLTAGVAHEINNPTNFITASTEVMLQNTNELIDINKLLTENTPAQNANALISEKIKEFDPEYLITESRDLIQAMADGITRTTEIITGLQQIENESNKAVTVNVNQLIDSSLLLLKHKYDDNITIIKKYGDLPDITIDKGKLNQVIMNILLNAIDATIEYNNKETKVITITTHVSNHTLSIKIEDTGIGMSDEILSHIFDPFFTTKDIGKGSGLGLFITRKIINECNGDLNVTSKHGEGSSFEVVIPVTLAEPL